jgi:hypothetical protein
MLLQLCVILWDFHCNLRPGPVHVLGDVSFIHPLAAYLRSAARTSGHAAALQDADKRRDCYADHACPDYAFRTISFQKLGRCNFSAKPPTPPFPTPGISVTHALPTCTANPLWCSVATCPACLPLPLTSTLPARDLAGSAAHRYPLQRLRTEGCCSVLLV